LSGKSIATCATKWHEEHQIMLVLHLVTECLLPNTGQKLEQ
jgi:hypothetical protein